MNLAPFSFFNVMGDDPPILAIGITRGRQGMKDTARNIEETGEFVVNLVPEALAEVIRVWLTRHKRWGSSVYLAGESYGTTRGAAIADRLQAVEDAAPAQPGQAHLEAQLALAVTDDEQLALLRKIGSGSQRAAGLVAVAGNGDDGNGCHGLQQPGVSDFVAKMHDKIELPFIQMGEGGQVVAVGIRDDHDFH